MYRPTAALFTLLVFINQLSSQNSVLNTGIWYKMAVSQNGIYKLSYSDLQNIGIPVSTVDPRNIRIYGDDGGMLPEDNSESRVGLEELSIYVLGENDGTFDTGDYILFYGEGPDEWNYNSLSRQFEHAKNIYNDFNYYFINADLGTGKRIQAQSASLQPATDTSNTFDDYVFHEKDSVNFIHSGRNWYGEEFGIISNQDFHFRIDNIDTSEQVLLNIVLAARSTLSQISFDIYAEGSLLTSVPIATVPATYTSPYAKNVSVKDSFTVGDAIIDLTLTLNRNDTIARGWLDFISLNARRLLVFSGSQMLFRDSRTVALGKVTDFVLQANPNVTVWDVTNLHNVKGQQTIINGNTVSFRLSTDSLKEFVAFDNSSFMTPSLYGSMPNQNLLGMSSVNMVIVTHSDFLAAANRLADHHRIFDGLSVGVVTTDQVYNEFSSGAQDITAVRDFLRKMYQNPSADSLKYLLLFGDASYDFKDRIAGNTNFVPTYESANSLDPTQTYCSDDYFGFLEDNEGTTGDVDIGIGRLPVKNLQEANATGDKIIRYTDSLTLGKWRKEIVFIGDDEDGSIHMVQANDLAEIIEQNYCDYNTNKIYLDNYQEVFDTTTGSRYPDVNQEIFSSAQAGALIMNYTGHGGPVGWAHERVFDRSDISTWANTYRVPLIIAATAEANLLDDPAAASLGEVLVLDSASGSIACFGASRLTYSGANFTLNRALLNHLFESVNNEMLPLGDVVKIAKRTLFQEDNHKKYILVGDPALRLAYPKNNIVVQAINATPVATIPETLISQNSYTVEGEIQDKNGLLLSNFDGWLQVSLFDKRISDTTMGNNGANPYVFKRWRAPFLTDSVFVTNGLFSITLTVPEGIDSILGFGKMSLYADDGSTDASGCYTNFLVGGGFQTISAIEHADANISFKVYPSPGSGNIVVELTGMHPEDAAFFIHDELGREVKKIIGISSNKFSFSTKDFSKGIYLCTFMDEKNGFKKTSKLLVN